MYPVSNTVVLPEIRCLLQPSVSYGPTCILSGTDKHPDALDLLFLLDPPAANHPARLNPYLVLVHAMDVLLGCTYIPADTSLSEWDEVNMKRVLVERPNPVQEYQELLLKFRDLCAPLPLCNPRSLAGGGSNTGPGPTSTPTEAAQQLYEALSGDCCVVCGAKEGDCVNGATEGVSISRKPVVQTNSYDWDHTFWLYKLGILADDFSPRDSARNMILCKAHAESYVEGIWRWVPSTQHRKELAELKIQVDGQEETMRNQGSDEDESDDEKPTITFKSHPEILYDLLIFQPRFMPPFRRDEDGALIPPVLAERVVTGWRRLRLDHIYIFAIALGILGTVYWPPPDDKLREVERECLAIRDHWNAQAVLMQDE
ncbi:hypothetical protein C8Q70DRAFT_94842 [Cubamyces menziesii]|nr:hypothetical protein C8Q70DRAFT_94842 [Cubamyces menziesii]